jgi:hypothetical protein
VTEAHWNPFEGDLPPDDALPADERWARITDQPESVTGNAAVTTDTPKAPSVTRYPTPSVGNTVTLYVNVSVILDGDEIAGLRPTFGYCTDGVAIFYAGHVNSVFGDPESGKTMLCLACAAQALNRGHRVAVVDLDHNGASAIIDRLIDLGANEDHLRDPDQFRYYEPEDGAAVLAIVDELTDWGAEFVVIDSVGELVPAFAGSSNSPDDYTRVHRMVLTPLAQMGACVVTIDHLAKNAESRTAGPTGTAAKKRAISGAMLRVKIDEAFTPGKGGAAIVTIVKDRHGALRAARPVGDREPIAAVFRMTADHDSPWELKAPRDGARNPDEAAPDGDLDALDALDPPPTSVRNARERLKWNNQRAMLAMRDWRRYRVTDTQGAVTGNTLCAVCHEPMSTQALALGAVHVGCEATQ